MSAVGKPTEARVTIVVLTLAVVVLISIGAGWLLPANQSCVFGHVYAVLHPVGLAAMCIVAIRRNAQATPWVVGLLLVVLLLDIARGWRVPS